MKHYNILIVDDDIDIIEVISLYLNNPLYNIYTANSSAEALKNIKNISFDLIILDIMLPDVNGTHLCKKIRKFIYCPILFISCIDDEDYILDALKIGGDDYIRKPFNPKELVARVESNLRRVNYYKNADIISNKKLTIKNIVVDLEKSTVLRDNKEILLSPIEYDILIFMVNNSNRPIDYSEIYENVWKSQSLGDIRTVMVHVSNLRKKIEGNSDIKFIKTIKKKGYMFLNE